MTELLGLPSLPIMQLDERLENLRVIDPSDWTKAQERERVILVSLQCDGPMTMRVEAAAKTLGLSARTVRRLITRYTASAQTTSLIGHRSGPKKSCRRPGPELERIMDAAIQTHYLVRPRKPMEEVYKEVRRRCHAENRVTPSRNSVLRRIRALDARLVARKRLGAKSAESIALSTPGMLEATEALSGLPTSAQKRPFCDEQTADVRMLRPQQLVSNSSWPSELGIASTSGTSTQMRYAYFPQHRRLAVELRGVVTIYDTAEYQFRGMLLAHSAETVGTSILTQRSRVRLTDVVTVSAPTPLSE